MYLFIMIYYNIYIAMSMFYLDMSTKLDIIYYFSQKSDVNYKNIAKKAVHRKNKFFWFPGKMVLVHHTIFIVMYLHDCRTVAYYVILITKIFYYIPRYFIFSDVLQLLCNLIHMFYVTWSLTFLVCRLTFLF